MESVPNRSILVGIVGLRELIAAGVRYSDGSLPADVVAELDAALEGIERDLDRELNPSADAPAPDRVTCGLCRAAFEWPGLLDAHFRSVHWGQPWRRAA